MLNLQEFSKHHTNPVLHRNLLSPAHSSGRQATQGQHFRQRGAPQR